MVKQYHQKATQGSRNMNQSRVRSFDDQWIDRRPQAKDVLPYRTLQDYDEDLLQQQHNEDDKSLFLNPLVPKRRRYLAQENQSNLLSSLSSISEPSSSSSSPSKRPKTTHDTQQNDLMDRLLHPENTMTQQDNLEEDTQPDDDDDNDTTQQSQQDEEDEHNNEPSTSEIPQTELMQQYHDFIQNLKESPLHSLK